MRRDELTGSCVRAAGSRSDAATAGSCTPSSSSSPRSRVSGLQVVALQADTRRARLSLDFWPVAMRPQSNKLSAAETGRRNGPDSAGSRKRSRGESQRSLRCPDLRGTDIGEWEPMRLENGLSDGARRAASSLSDSTANESSTTSSLSAARGWVSRLQVVAPRVETLQAYLGVRHSWGVRVCDVGAQIRVPADVLDSWKGR